MLEIRASAPTAARGHRRLLVSLIAVIAVITAALTWPAPKPASSASSASSIAPSLSLPPSGRTTATAPPVEHQRADRQGATGQAGGALPGGVTVLDDRYPGVTNLDPALLRALRAAAAQALPVGVTLYVNSGWRSPEHQNQLLRQAIAKYGSKAEAARWVATAQTSPHVSGDAVDIGRFDATAWLSEHGARYGLCQIYRNEPWHFELRPRAVDHGCPRRYADPTQDPRMQR
jgi:hypothetical protein